MQRSRIVLETLEVGHSLRQAAEGAEDEDRTQGSSFAHVHVSKGNLENDVPCDYAQRKSGVEGARTRGEQSSTFNQKKESIKEA